MVGLLYLLWHGTVLGRHTVGEFSDRYGRVRTEITSRKSMTTRSWGEEFEHAGFEITLERSR